MPLAIARRRHARRTFLHFHRQLKPCEGTGATGKAADHAIQFTSVEGERERVFL
jgi:hypothetical protein